jgi:phage FluMu gp28-like protein
MTETETMLLEAPAVPLYDYQRRWVADKSRFKIGCWTRQGGKSFGVALEAVDDANETAQNWVALSRGERQSRELMEKARMHAKAYAAGASAIDESMFKVDDNEYLQLTIVLNNGARIIGLPANPDTARGYTANVILDEFAIHKDSLRIWAAMYGSITRGFKVRIVSTPMGKQNKFYSLWTGDNGYSKHFTDIYAAVKEGLDVNVEELRKGLDDDEIWAQEYECQFLDEATAFLTFELICGCESEQASMDFDEAIVAPREFYLGWDIGRKKDLTVLWVIEKIGDVFWTRAVIRLEKTPYQIQQDFIEALIRKLNIRRCCGDATGIGAHLGENLQTRFGTYRVEPVVFTEKVKSDLAVRMLRTYQDHRIRIPIENRLRNALHSVKKVVTAAGHIRFDAERTKDGHADEFWANALALMATDQGAIKPEIFHV